MQVYEVNKKLLQEHAAPLMAVYLHGVAVVREELNMDVSKKPVKGRPPAHDTLLDEGFSDSTLCLQPAEHLYSQQLLCLAYRLTHKANLQEDSGPPGEACQHDWGLSEGIHSVQCCLQSLEH